jgi:hypothetical protein
MLADRDEDSLSSRERERGDRQRRNDRNSTLNLAGREASVVGNLEPVLL